MNNFKTEHMKMGWQKVIINLLFAALGVIFIVTPKESANTICYIFGGILVAGAIIFAVRILMSGNTLDKYYLIPVCIMLIVGIIFLVNPDFIQRLLMIFIGIYIIINAFIIFYTALYYRSIHDKKWIILLVLAIVSLSLGISVTFISFDSVMIFVGICIIFNAIENLIINLMVNNKIKKMPQSDNNQKPYIDEEKDQ